MVRTKGPFLSCGAHGSLADLLTASEWKGRSYIKYDKTPRDPKTGLQISARAIARFLAKQWHDKPQLYLATWQAYAKTVNLDAYTAYMKYNLARWGRFKPPTAQWPVNLTWLPGDVFVFTGEPANRTVMLECVMLMLRRNWVLTFFRSQTPGFTPGRDTAIHAQKATIPSKYTLRDGPLPAGTYYYRAIPSALFGKWGTNPIQVTAVVPG